MRSSSHTAPKLMKLCQSKAFRILHHHHRSIGNVDPDLYNGGGYKNINCPRRKIFHNPVLVRRPHFTVQIRHMNIGGKSALQLFRVIHHVFQIVQFSFFHLRTNHIRLSARLHFLFDKFVSFGTVCGIHHTILDGQPVRR